MEKQMDKNEVRVFRITGEAINELMWELLNKAGELFLDLPENSETIFRLNWDKEKDELSFYALEFAHPHQVNFEAIDSYIKEHIEITADSLFNPNIEIYKTFSLNEIST